MRRTSAKEARSPASLSSVPPLSFRQAARRICDPARRVKKAGLVEAAVEYVNYTGDKSSLDGESSGFSCLPGERGRASFGSPNLSFITQTYSDALNSPRRRVSPLLSLLPSFLFFLFSFSRSHSPRANGPGDPPRARRSRNEPSRSFLLDLLYAVRRDDPRRRSLASAFFLLFRRALPGISPVLIGVYFYEPCERNDAP